MRACLRVMVHINTATVIWKLCTRIHTWGFGVRGKRREGGSWHKLGFTLLRQLRVALEEDRRPTRAEADKPSRQALHVWSARKSSVTNSHLHPITHSMSLMKRLRPTLLLIVLRRCEERRTLDLTQTLPDKSVVNDGN